MTVTPSQENLVSGTCGAQEQASLRTYATDDHVDLAQHDGCVQMTGISTKEVLSQTSTQVILENTSVYNIMTGASHGVLLKTNEFVKQVSILLTFFFTLSF